MCGLEEPTEENRRVHQLQLRRLLHGPTAHQEQGSQATCIELIDVGNVKHQHADTLNLLDPAPELVESRSAHHASRAVHDRYILQAFDLKLEFHISLHTNLLWKKFRDLVSLNWTWKGGKSHQEELTGSYRIFEFAESPGRRYDQ